MCIPDFFSRPLMAIRLLSWVGCCKCCNEHDSSYFLMGKFNIAVFYIFPNEFDTQRLEQQLCQTILLQNFYSEILTPIPQNVTSFGNRVLKEVIKVQ